MTTESQPAPARAVSPFSAIAIAVVLTLGVLYIVSMFLRNSVGVIAPDLAAEVGLTPIETSMQSLGPNRSSATPSGNCVAAKTKK